MRYQGHVASGLRTHRPQEDPYSAISIHLPTSTCLFGADKQNMKIVDVPIRYQERFRGETNIQRWRHGAIRLGMVIFAAKKD